MQEKQAEDIEEQYAQTDKLLCAILRDLGDGEGVDIYESGEGWTANRHERPTA